MALLRMLCWGGSKTIVLVVLSLFALQMLAYPEAKPSTYAGSNSGIVNIQTTHSLSAGALDPNEQCLRHADYNSHHSESWIAVDPNNPNHLVGESKFFSNPRYYLSHDGTMVSRDGGRSWRDAILPGFDCRTSPENSWSDTTDPVIAFDSKSNLYSPVLAFNLRYNSTGDLIPVNPGDEVSVVRSTDGGSHWAPANSGVPLLLHSTPDTISDKPWISSDTNLESPFRDYVYVAWTVIDSNGNGDVWFSRSADQGQHFTQPVRITSAANDGNYNTQAIMDSAPDGTLYLSYLSFPNISNTQTDAWVLTSTDGGLSFSQPRLAASFISPITFDRPNTTFREFFDDSFAVDRSNGHLLLAYENDSGSGLDVYLTASSNKGLAWTRPIPVNDPSTIKDGTDQFQPTVAVADNGIVGVAFYDRRLPCPSNGRNILPADAGRRNFCINTSIQFYKDGLDELQPLGQNIRVSKATWDPQNPGTTTGQLPRPGGPKGNETFIGDYFGLALTTEKAFVLFTSNYSLDRGNDSNNQEQILSIVPLPRVEQGDGGDQSHSRLG